MSSLTVEHRTIATNGVELHAVLAGPADGPAVLLLHGFPEFWYGWRHQIDALAQAGHRVIVPDLRGYNLSSKPGSSQDYTAEVVQRDILGLLDHFGLAQADLIGHDWGGLLAWWLATYHPQRLRRMVVLNAPHPQVFRQFIRHHPSQALRSAYLAFFQMPWAPETLLRAGDYFWLQQAMRRTSRADTFSAADLARYREAWAQPSGLRGMLNWYRGLRHSIEHATPAQALSVPTLIIWGERDVALSRRLASLSLERCLAGRLELIPTAGHWVQHEAAAEVNSLALQFLADRAVA
jgi:pimeloyl-ACP methyl ester carboxylesterase